MSSSSYSCIGDLDEVMKGVINLERLQNMWNANPDLSPKQVKHDMFVTPEGEIILKVTIWNAN